MANINRSSNIFTGKNIDYSEQEIRNDGFWPDITVAEFKRRSVQPVALGRQAIAADVPGPERADGNNVLTEHYLGTVFARASATERPITNQITEHEPAIRENLLAISQQPVRVIKDRRRIGVILL